MYNSKGNPRLDLSKFVRKRSINSSMDTNFFTKKYGRLSVIFCVVKIVLNSFELYNPFFTLSPGIWKRHVGGGGEGEKQFEYRPAVVSFSKI